MVRTKEENGSERRGSAYRKLLIEHLFVCRGKQWCIYKVLLRFTWFVAPSLLKIFKNSVYDCR